MFMLRLKLPKNIYMKQVQFNAFLFYHKIVNFSFFQNIIVYKMDLKSFLNCSTIML